MAEELEAEIQALQSEYEWVLKEEVHVVLRELETILIEACKRFPVQIGSTGEDNLVKPDKFVLSTPASSGQHQQIKCMLTLMADSICEADLALKLNKQHPVPWQTKIYPEYVWKVQQIQDTGNHLTHALSHIRAKDADYQFRSSAEVVRLLDDIMDALNRGRTCLALPKRKSLEELIKNPSLKAFKPSLPSDVSLSFYIQAQKLVLAVYQLYINPAQKVDIQARYQVECSVPWLNDTLVLFSLALQQCQQLRDKVTVFAQYDAENKYLRQPIPISSLAAVPAASVSTNPFGDITPQNELAQPINALQIGSNSLKTGSDEKPVDNGPNGVNNSLIDFGQSLPPPLVKLPPDLGPPPPIPPRSKSPVASTQPLIDFS